MIITIDRDRHQWSFDGGLKSPDISLAFNTSYFRFVWNPCKFEAPVRSGYSKEINGEGDLLYHNLWIGKYFLVWTTRTKLGQKKIRRYKGWCRESKRSLSYKSWKKSGYEWDCKLKDRDAVMGYTT